MKEIKKYPTRAIKSWARMKELRTDHFWHTWKAHDRGNLVVMGQPTLDAVLAGFGNVATPGYDPNFNRVLRNVDKILEYQEVVDAQGYGHELCSAMRVQLGGMFLGTNVRSPEGKVVKPDFIFQWHNCAPLAKCAQIAGEHMGVPYFLVDAPPTNIPGWKEWFILQMQEFIEWAEKLTGREYDDEALIESVKNEWECRVTFAKIGQLTSVIPAPIDSRHMQSLRMPSISYGYKKEGVEYAHMLLDEVELRVKDGISARGFEGMRMLGRISTMFNVRLSRFPERYGVISIPGPRGAFDVWKIMEDGTWTIPQTPMAQGINIRTREDALGWGAELWLGEGSRQLLTQLQPQAAISEIKQWQADGVLLWRDHSTEAACGSPSGAGVLEIKLAMDKAGIPAFFYESSRADPRYFDEAKVLEQATFFFENTLGLPKIFD